MRVADAYYRLLALTLLGLIAADGYNGIWDLQAGRIYPYRHVPIVPLYGTAGLVVEWTALALAAAALWFRVRRGAALGVGALALLATLTQHYSNHVALTFMVLLFTALRPPVTDADLTRPNMLLVRWELAIVYVFGGLNKILAGFLDGESLSNLYLALREPLLPREWLAAAFRPPAVVVLSAGVVGFELFAPLILSRWPRLGIALVAVFHAGITILMPGILPFGLVMVTMAVLYLRPGTSV